MITTDSICCFRATAYNSNNIPLSPLGWSLQAYKLVVSYNPQDKLWFDITDHLAYCLYRAGGTYYNAAICRLPKKQYFLLKSKVYLLLNGAEKNPDNRKILVAAKPAGIQPYVNMWRFPLDVQCMCSVCAVYVQCM